MLLKFNHGDLLMDRNYQQIIEEWVRDFINSMNSDVIDGYARQGEDFGNIPKGIKIIFDGYGYNENTDVNDDINMISFAVFIHKNSINDYFPEHESAFNSIIHRPKEECCIYVWYNVSEDNIEVLPFEDSGSTELSNDLITDIIFKIKSRNPYILG